MFAVPANCEVERQQEQHNLELHSTHRVAVGGDETPLTPVNHRDGTDHDRDGHEAPEAGHPVPVEHPAGEDGYPTADLRERDEKGNEEGQLHHLGELRWAGEFADAMKEKKTLANPTRSSQWACGASDAAMGREEPAAMIEA